MTVVDQKVLLYTETLSPTAKLNHGNIASLVVEFRCSGAVSEIWFCIGGAQYVAEWI
jgi:hypothetical protein